MSDKQILIRAARAARCSRCSRRLPWRRYAHHSFGAQYDSNKPIKMTGVVTQLEWTNPHVYLFIDVTDKTGKVDELGLRDGPAAHAAEGGLEEEQPHDRREVDDRRLARA